MRNLHRCGERKWARSTSRFDAASTSHAGSFMSARGTE
jgi:hypothetical protein